MFSYELHFRLNARSSLAVAILLTSVGLWGQVDHSKGSDLLARLSYDSSAGSVITEGDGLRDICIAISRDGYYRVVRSLNNGQKERRQGKIQEQQVGQLKRLISDSEFRDLSGSHGGVILQAAESFGAEIPREDGPQRLQWLNADGASPFPTSVFRVVEWLEHFEPTGGKPFSSADYSEVCPSAGVRLLHPQEL